ncbi:MAG: carboxylesterase family protein [Salegentibacter sp.]
MKFISSRTSAFLLILLIAPMAALPQQKQPVQTRIENGLIEGYQDSGENLDIYLGIPFAQPPVEELRWKAPQPAKDWKGVRETKKFGPAAVQTNVFGDMIYRGDGKSEDCLYLNVWTPSGNKTENLPVLVYFYGGGFVAGDGSEPRYDGAAMAQRGMVTVTVNYRLNIFGFFAHPGLTAESPNNASGNYGLLDQNMALKWVQKNIAAFGGDPGRVTIAGESAGSISVSEQMASPLSKDLFAGAIGESGAAIKPTLAPVPLKKAEEIGVKFAENAGYSLEELRKLSTDELFKLYNDSGLFGFPSVIDGYFLPKPLPEIFRAGEQAQVPLLVGWNSAEVSGTGFMQGEPYSKENYIAKVKAAYPENYEKVLKLYPASSEEEIEASATALASDGFISYSTWKWFDLQRRNSEQPVYRYMFSRIQPRLKKGNGQTPTGAPHASEIPYFLGNLSLIENGDWTKQDYAVSEVIQKYLANFINTGNPNGEGLPKWPAAEEADTNPPVMILDVDSRARPAEDEARYLFLDNFYGND